jgi:hypothetical protein
MNIEIKKIKLSGVTITAETEEEKKKGDISDFLQNQKNKVNIIIPDFLKKKNEKKKYSDKYCHDEYHCCGPCPVRDECEDYEAPYEDCNGDCNDCNHNAACSDVDFDCPDHEDCTICEYRDKCPDADDDDDEEDDYDNCNYQNECSVYSKLHDKEAVTAAPTDKFYKRKYTR